MSLIFPSRGNGVPWIRLDAKAGEFVLSVIDGDPQRFDLTGRVLTIDIARAAQGWLALTPAGADWQPLKTPGAWVDRPSPDHKDACSVMVHCDAFPGAKIRQFRGNSRAHNGFVQAVSQRAGDIEAGRSPKLMIEGLKSKRIGQGSTVEVLFELAPAESWADASIFDDAHPMAKSETSMISKPQPKNYSPINTASRAAFFNRICQSRSSTPGRLTHGYLPRQTNRFPSLPALRVCGTNRARSAAISIAP